MDKLRTFAGDIHTKEALIEFIKEYIAETALEKMYKKEDVSHIADAQELILGAFEALDMMYELKKPQHESVNQAK